MAPSKRSRRLVLRALAVAMLVAGCDAGNARDPRPEASVPAPERAATSAPEVAVEPAPRATSAPPRQVAAAGFVGSEACGACHESAFAAWSESHHDLAMQEATAETLLGDFADRRVARFPVMTRFHTGEGGAPRIEADGPDGRAADFGVAYTFGVEPLQQVLVPMPGGQLQVFGLAWDPAASEWIDLYPGERFASDDALHWTGRYQSWNAMCADCHSTLLRKGYDLDTDTYATTWAEIDVGCEACHGAGGDHVEWARARERVGPGAAPPTSTPTSSPNPKGSGLQVHFGPDTPGREIESCAPCHSRRHRVSDAWTPGEPFLDAYMPELLRPGLYYPDGQIDAEVYVWGSFAQSRMYAAGVRCSDCHEPHSLGLRAEGNALCGQCHGQKPSPRFPALRSAIYDAPEHHHHAQDSAGASCVACHMPERTYMQVDVRHDHRLRIPRPDVSARLGTPDPCTACHTDRSAAWAADVVAGWSGAGERGAVYGDVFARARSGEPDAAFALIELAADATQPVIVRATALESLQAYGPAGVEVLLRSSAADEPLLRVAALAALDGFPTELRLAAAAPRLDDPVRAVRVEAGRLLADADSATPPERRAALRAALGEYEAAQRTDADLPAGRLNLALVAERRGDAATAEREYRKAIDLDADFLPARVNLATLYNRTGRNADALRELRAAIERAPEEGEIHYSEGLLLAEMGRLDDATAALTRAAERIPGRARVQYNLALALEHGGRHTEALPHLERAHALDPGDPAIARALISNHVRDGRFDDALVLAEGMVAVAPDAPGPRQLLAQVRAMAAAAQRDAATELEAGPTDAPRGSAAGP